VSTSTKWFHHQRPRPNLLTFYLKRIPTAITFTIMGFLPPLAVAFPGVALAEDPLWYAAWCGVGFPVLSVAVRFFSMQYFTKYAHNLVKAGRLAPEGVVPQLSTVSFMTAASLMFGNTMLLYLSINVRYAASSSAFAILTEVAGKIYAVVALNNKSKFEKELRKQASRVAGMATGGEAAAEADEDKKKLEEQKVMFAVRMSNEIIAEKVCIVICALINARFVETPRSGATIAIYALIFFCTEVVADALLVFVLVKYFDVPILRLPREKFERFSGEFWSGIFEIALVPVCGAFFFLHAFLSANEWLSSGDDDAPDDDLGSMANATEV
jgi:hypothetical protein